MSKMKADEASPTIASISAMLNSGGQRRVPPMLLLKAEIKSPPIFMATGIGDTVVGLFLLAAQMRVSQPIYGMSPRGTDGLDEPLDSIEEMAQYHLDAVRQVQPTGPYFFIGYSLGGVVVMEMARQLQESGERIALLAMVESYPHRGQLSVAQHARLAVRLAKRRAAKLLWSDKHAQKGTILSDRPAVDEAVVQAMKEVKIRQQRALRNFRPRFYEGKIKFVKAAIPSFFPSNPLAVWARYARTFEIETVPGDHLGILTTHVETVAAILSRYVEEAIAEM